MLFTASRTRTAFEAANIEVMPLVDHSRKTLVRGGTYGRYLPSGYLVYVNQDGLFAVPFDAERPEVHRTPFPVLDQISYNAAQGSAQLDFPNRNTDLSQRWSGMPTPYCCVAGWRGGLLPLAIWRLL